MRIFGIEGHSILGIGLIRVLQFMKTYMQEHQDIHTSDLGISVHWVPFGGERGDLPDGWVGIPPYEQGGFSICTHAHPPAYYKIGHIMAIPIMRESEAIVIRDF